MGRESTSRGGDGFVSYVFSLSVSALGNLGSAHVK